MAFNILRGGLGDYGIRADGVRDDDGSIGPRTKDALSAAAAIFGLTGPTWVEKTVARVEAEVASGPSHVAASLGFRALAVALREWCAGVCEEPPGSNSGPRIAQYFQVCDRDGRPVGMRAGEWCAAAASWCVERARREGERVPHGLRVSGKELEDDLKPGAWMPIEHVRSGLYRLRPGDLVILSRAGTWTRHVCRLVAHRGDTIWTLGGNENNRWRLTARKLSDGDMLGFGAYPASWTEEDERRVAELCPGTAAKMVSEAVCT